MGYQTLLNMFSDSTDKFSINWLLTNSNLIYVDKFWVILYYFITQFEFTINQNSIRSFDKNALSLWNT